MRSRRARPIVPTPPFLVLRQVGLSEASFGRWQVFDSAGVLVGAVVEQRRKGDPLSTFTVVHNPTSVPFRPPPGRRLRALGAWSSSGHPTLPAAVAELIRHLTNGATPDEVPPRTG